MAVQPFVGLWPLFSYLIVYTVGRTPWTGISRRRAAASTYRAAQTQNKRTLTSMPQMGFERTTSVFERAKSIDALDSAATVIDFIFTCRYETPH
jgi:hypothetical protein